MKIELVRFCYGDDATLGWLYAGDCEFAAIERPWVPDRTYGSAPSESCVPDGTYDVVQHNSRRFPNTFALVNEDLRVSRYRRHQFRYGILIHIGNWAHDVEGCIAVGMRHGLMDNKHLVYDSVDAMSALRSVLGDGEHTLEIRRTEGAPYDAS